MTASRKKKPFSYLRVCEKDYMMWSLLRNGQSPQKKCASCHCLTAPQLRFPTGTALSSARILKYWFLREIKCIFSGKHLVIQQKTENCTLEMAPLFTQNCEFCAGLKWFGFRQMCRTRQEIRKQMLWVRQKSPRSKNSLVLPQFQGFIGWFEGFFVAQMRHLTNQHHNHLQQWGLRSASQWLWVRFGEFHNEQVRIQYFST